MDLVRGRLDIALQAPSGSDAQSWHWPVITGSPQRGTVQEVHRQQVARSAESGSFAARLLAVRPERAVAQQRVGGGALWPGEHMGHLPVLVVPCMATGRPLPASNQGGLWGSLQLALRSSMLAARARGGGAAWTSLHPDRW